MISEPFVAVVIDPIRTMATNKVNIESFRTYPDGYKPSISDDQVLALSDFTVPWPFIVIDK